MNAGIGPELPGIAFASATPAPSGTVLIAGTGTVATRITDGVITATAGGLGWLLGDEGSGFWLGRAAVRATVEFLSGRADAPVLASLVIRHLVGAARPTPNELITAVYD